MILLIQFEIKQTFNCCSTSIQYFFNKPENSRDLDHVMDCTMGWNYFWRKIILSVKMQARKNENYTLRDVFPPTYLYLIFEILWFKKMDLMNLIFSLFQTWIWQATEGRIFLFKLGKRNPVHQTWHFKLQIVKCR